MVSNLLALLSLQWGLHNSGEPQRIAIDHYTSGYVQGIRGEDAHLPAPQAGRKIIVAVLDTGVDATHPQLKNRLASKGYNFVANNDDTTDTHGHGTHLSGIIAAQAFHEGELQGLTQNALILPVKVVQTGPNAPIRPQAMGANMGTALTENVAKGITYAVEHGAEVINLSLAWPSGIHSDAVDQAVALAKQKQVLIVSSAGNDATTANVYPCIYESVICVGAHGPDGALTYFSNHGGMVDILAPGIAILSSWPLNKSPTTFAGQIGYEFKNGTSMASPFVAAALAELLSRGYTAQESVSRLLLSTRTSAEKPHYTSPIVGSYSTDHPAEEKVIRFGNLDLSGAVSITASPFILPARKAPYEVRWDGSSESVTIPLQWINRWKSARAVEISMNDQTFHFASVASNETVTTPVIVKLNTRFQNSMIHLRGRVHALAASRGDLDYVSDEHTPSGFDIGIQISRAIAPVQHFSDLPRTADVKTIPQLVVEDDASIRSVVNADAQHRADLVILRTEANLLKMTLVKDSTLAGMTRIQGLATKESPPTADQLLNLYRLPDQTYGAVFTVKEKNASRPDFLIQIYDASLKLLREIRLGTDITVMNENFKWVKSSEGYAPVWISVGYTPPKDQPKYDPWNPNHQDQKMPRIYYFSGKDPRTLKLEAHDFPLQMLSDGKILISNGEGYFQAYYFLSLEDGKIIKRERLSLDLYRMLIGSDTGINLISLKGDPANTLVISGQSTPGNLRVSGIGTYPFDQILNRASFLDSLVQVSGAYTNGTNASFFVQTHYDLKLFDSTSDQTASVSLNRYSYIPSMIATRNFYPLLIKDENGNGLPAIYIPASGVNDYISEIAVGMKNEKGQLTLVKPAQLRFTLIDPNCTELGNLIPATEFSPAQQVFICGNTVVRIPLVLK